jgi:HlyD family secretion protein
LLVAGTPVLSPLVAAFLLRFDAVIRRGNFRPAVNENGWQESRSDPLIRLIPIRDDLVGQEARSMRWVGRAWPLIRTWAIVGVIAVLVYLVASYETGIWPWADRRPLRQRYHFGHVSRAILAPFVNAAGRLDSSKRTVLRCELENIAGAGSASASSGASTLISMLAEGSVVKQGDVLATFDGSAYEEMYRQQLIVVEQAKSSHLQATLDLEIALLAVRQFRDGIVQETRKEMEGAIALAKSDRSRAADHLDWTKRMNRKGYSSAAQVVSEQHGVSLMDFSLKRQLMSLDLFERFTQPKTEKTLKGQVLSAQTSLNNEKLRLQRQLDRLALLKKQLDRCTISAPHDGVLFYANDPERNVLIEEGMPVRQRQELFYLPDLTQLEVQVALNESVVDRVRVGDPAHVRFEALPNLVLGGRLVSISQIPAQPGGRRSGGDVRYFMGVVKLESPSEALKPGMSTRVDIALSPQQNALVVPHEAVKSNGRKKVCFVAHAERLERREVVIGDETTDVVQVVDGLEEGELVALDPPATLTGVEPLSTFDDIDSGQPAPPNTIVATQH